MTDRGLRVAGLGIGAFTLALVATTVVLVVATDGQAANQFEDSWAEIASAVLTLGGTGAGLAILWRRPRNRIGWVLLLPALGLASEDAAVAAVNTTHVVLATPSLATEILAVVSDALWLPSTGVGIVALFLLFPDGRPTGRVARWALRVVVVASGAYALAILLGEGPLYALATVDNPMGIPGSRPLLEPVVGVATGVVFLGGLVGLGSLVRRWRSAGPHTRAQLKWFLAAAALTVVTVTAVSLLAEDSGTRGRGGPSCRTWPRWPCSRPSRSR